MTPRDQIFGSIRRSLGVNGAERPRRAVVEQRLAGHPAGVIPARATGKSRRELVALFVEMAEASAATVSIVRDAADAPAAIAEFLRAHNLSSRLRRGDDPRLAGLPWDRTAIEVSTGRSFGDDAAGVSAAFGAAAETGTLILLSGPENPTTLNFLPDNHIVLVDAADVASTYEDVWGRVRERCGPGTMPRTVNWITGPSRSADIEQILLMGAHGPRRLHVVLVDPEAELMAADMEAEMRAGGSTPAEPRVGSTLAADPKAPEDTPPGPAGGEDDDDEDDVDDLEDEDDGVLDDPDSDREDEDDRLEEELEETFPASDPPSQTQP